MPLTVGRDRASGLTISRIAVPMPAFLPSVNQIGFDRYDWIVGTIARTKSTLLLWVIGAVKDARGNERVDPSSAFSFPLAGRYRGGSVILASPSVPLQFSFGVVPLRRFEMRGELGPSLNFAPGASLYAETVCATVPNYGAELTFTGICNPKGVLAASGTFIGSGYRGSAVSRPAGVHAGAVTLRRPTANADGAVTAMLAGPRLPSARHHVAAVLLVDSRSGAPISLDYRSDTSVGRDRNGRIHVIRVRIPRGTRLPSAVRAYVIVDAFPIAQRRLR
jgi:hypothetical protein